MDPEIAIDDPLAPDVRALLADHLAFSRGSTPAEYSFALDVDQLVDPGVTFFTARCEGELVGVAALKRLDQDHAELKSMHTRRRDRRRGVGRAMVEHLVEFASGHGYRRLSLETGSTDEFIAARTLYARCGFRACEPFGDYVSSAFNTFMTMRIDGRASR